MRKSQPEAPLRLPVKLGPCSNGEYVPGPTTSETSFVIRSAFERIDRNARRLGIGRRELLRSSCGAAAVFLALNALGCKGGRYGVKPESALESAAADEALAGDDFVFDVQTHHVATDRIWWETEEPSAGQFLQRLPQAKCGEQSWVDCFGRDLFLREIFLESDTGIAVLSALWGAPEHNPLHVDEAALTRERASMVEGAPRLLIHGIVQPQVQGPEETRERMRRMVEEWKIAAWKLYPVWGPAGEGWWLDDEKGTQVIRDGLDAGMKLFAVHKGLPLPGTDPRYTRPRDVGAAAKAFPEATFLIYHSAFEYGNAEGPYDPEATRGIDALIRTVKDAGVKNVYAELGSLWREVLGRPDEAAHVLGKLLVHFGEDRILWGTDCVWYGSPQDQIQAFRAFEITPEFQERFGYPPLTKTAKARILGLNAARVYGIDVAAARAAHRDDTVARVKRSWHAAPDHRTHGPRDRAELQRLIRLQGGGPG